MGLIQQTIIYYSDNIYNKEVFFKYSPLVDPIKYMIGKYESSYNIYNLPSIKKEKYILEKVYDPNNSAYSDGFFYYLSSLLLTNYNFINGINYYGSFISNKNNFIVNIEDDMIEIQSIPDKKIYYIDFAYSGIPENLDIEKIVLRSSEEDISEIDKEKSNDTNTNDNEKEISFQIDNKYDDDLIVNDYKDFNEIKQIIN